MNTPLLIALVALVLVIGGLATLLLLRKAGHEASPPEDADNDRSQVDLWGRDVIPLNDENDATSLLLSLTMKTGTAAGMTWRPDQREWEIRVDDKSYSAPTQIEALRKAHLEVGK